jgi:hypothetical protein
VVLPDHDKKFWNRGAIQGRAIQENCQGRTDHPSQLKRGSIMTREAYVPQSYPLFAAVGEFVFPGNIGRLDVHDARAAVIDLINQQLDVQRVVAWLIEDDLDPDGGVFAKPITMRGMRWRWTVAETPDAVLKALEEFCMGLAAEQRAKQA